MIQLDFFESPEESEMRDIRNRIKSIAQSADKVRKGTYAKIGDIKKLVIDIDSRLEVIERGLCLSMKN